MQAILLGVWLLLPLAAQAQPFGTEMGIKLDKLVVIERLPSFEHVITLIVRLPLSPTLGVIILKGAMA